MGTARATQAVDAADRDEFVDDEKEEEKDNTEAGDLGKDT
jgi:hypothetical protein